MMRRFLLNLRSGIQALVFGGVILAIAASIYAFCVFSDASGDYRDYPLIALPFEYHISSPTPNEYYPAIHTSAENWNRVNGSYFQFAYAGTTSVTSLGRDHINLIFFDEAGINFPENTNAIAFSSTFTTNVNGDYQATESDLIYNARDYPPAMDGNPHQIDLEGVLTHELGHHIGIAHFGSVGSPPGCGELLPAATMYGVVAPGDTTKRSLHPHDRAAAIELYPEWNISLNVYDSLTQESIPLAQVKSPGNTLIYTLKQGGSQCPGFIVNDSLRTDQTGFVAFEPDTSDLSLAVSAFGYQSDTISVHFQDAAALPGTETAYVSVALLPRQNVNVTGSLQDSVTSNPFGATLKFYAKHDPGEEPTQVVSTDSLGNFSASFPPDEYYIEGIAEYPYPDFFDTQTFSDSVTELSYTGKPIQILYIYEDYTTENFRQMRTALDSLGYRYYYWDMAERDSLPSQDSFSELTQPMIMVWSTGDAVVDLLDSTKQAYITQYLDNGGRLFLSGTNLAWKRSDSPLLRDYLNVEYVDKATQSVLQSSASDDPISQGSYAGYVQGIMAADMVQLTSTQYASTSFRYMTTENAALVRFDNGVYKTVYAAFGIEHLINDNPAFLPLDDLMDRIVLYLLDESPSGNSQENSGVPATFKVSSNYPNPFNPSTTIDYYLPGESQLTIRVYNIMGQTVRTIYSGQMESGHHSARWNGLNNLGVQVSSGMYFLQIETPHHSSIQKMMLLR